MQRDESYWAARVSSATISEEKGLRITPAGEEEVQSAECRVQSAERRKRCRRREKKGGGGEYGKPWGQKKINNWNEPHQRYDSVNVPREGSKEVR